MVNYSGTSLKFTMDKEWNAFYWNFLGNEVEPPWDVPDREGSQAALLAGGTVPWVRGTMHMETLGCFLFIVLFCFVLF